MSTIALRLTITGRVQGVGFRAWLRSAAEGAGVTGWVRNRRDGAVEALLAGDADAVRTLVERCRSGPAGAAVTGILTAPAAEVPPTGFAILRDA
ncbi:MAG: acylphosphatase [Bauldia sp.]|nr:acylphosphatase [Bauldia sp.]MCW5716451.1 acylphosphatase [Bauldia sp.]